MHPFLTNRSLSRRQSAHCAVDGVKLAEGEGFEPPVPLRAHMISSHAQSTGLCHPSACAPANTLLQLGFRIQKARISVNANPAFGGKGQQGCEAARAVRGRTGGAGPHGRCLPAMAVRGRTGWYVTFWNQCPQTTRTTDYICVVTLRPHPRMRYHRANGRGGRYRAGKRSQSPLAHGLARTGILR